MRVYLQTPLVILFYTYTCIRVYVQTPLIENSLYLDEATTFRLWLSQRGYYDTFTTCCLV